MNRADVCYLQARAWLLAQDLYRSFSLPLSPSNIWVGSRSEQNEQKLLDGAQWTCSISEKHTCVVDSSGVACYCKITRLDLRGVIIAILQMRKLRHKKIWWLTLGLVQAHSSTFLKPRISLLPSLFPSFSPCPVASPWQLFLGLQGWQ